MESIIEQVQKEYTWSNEYAKKVCIEYLKFMDLRNKNQNLSPSNDIDKFWHQHILNTKMYRNFCVVKYRRVSKIPFIHSMLT